MKALFKYAMIASAVIAAAACNDLMETSKSLFPQGEATILVAAREGVAPDTKSIRLSDGSVWWNPAEEVSVFYGSGSNGGSKFVSQNTDIAATAELSGDIQMSGSAANFWAVYPYAIRLTARGVCDSVENASVRFGPSPAFIILR